MAKSFTHTIVAEAKSLGLTGIEITNGKKNGKTLTGWFLGKAKIQVFFNPYCSDPRAPKNVVADLRRRVRASVEHAAGSSATERRNRISAI